MTRWTGYLDVRILHSFYVRFVTDMVISKAKAHFQQQTLDSLGHDGAAEGYCAKDIFRRIATPYPLPEEGEAAGEEGEEGGLASGAGASQ